MKTGEFTKFNYHDTQIYGIYLYKRKEDGMISYLVVYDSEKFFVPMELILTYNKIISI